MAPPASPHVFTSLFTVHFEFIYSSSAVHLQFIYSSCTVHVLVDHRTHTHHWNVSCLFSLAGQIAASPSSASPISSQQRGQRGGVPGPKGIAQEAAKALAQGKAPEG